MQELEPEAEASPRGRDAVVEALIASAAEIFAERGTGGASVREVAAAAGVNHALVFRHFGSKEQFVRAVLDHQLDALVARFRAAGVQPDAVAAVGESVAENEALWKLLTRAVLDGEVDFVAERSFPEIPLVVEAIARGARAGAVPASVEPRMLVGVVLAGALGWMLLDPVLARVVGTPGATPRRRRELARAAFAELLGAVPPGTARPTEAEAARATVPGARPAGAFAPRHAAPAGPSSGPPRGRAEVCDALVSAAMELFARRGPAAVSVREVAAAAGVNHALVFRHFGSKHGLVQAVWERAAEDLAGRAVGVPDHRGFTDLTEALAESETVWRLIARAILDGEGDTLAAAAPYRFVNAMVWAAARGQERGMVATRLHPRLIVAMVCAVGFGWLVFHPVLIPLLGLPERDPAAHREAVRDVVVEVLGWHGARSRGGRGN